MSWRCQVQVSDGEGQTRFAEFEGTGPFSVGRASDVDLRLDHPSVSSRHAMFRVVGDRVEIRDSGSRHGTFVDLRRVDGSEWSAIGASAVWIGDLQLGFAAEAIASPATVRVWEGRHVAQYTLEGSESDRLGPDELPADRFPGLAEHVPLEFQREAGSVVGVRTAVGRTLSLSTGAPTSIGTTSVALVDDTDSLASVMLDRAPPGAAGDRLEPVRDEQVLSPARSSAGHRDAPRGDGRQAQAGTSDAQGVAREGAARHRWPGGATALLALVAFGGLAAGALLLWWFL